jgi:hypothetical protein
MTREALIEQLLSQRANGLVAPALGFDAQREPLRAVEVLELHGAGFEDVTPKL